jgi:hypothetical protein
MGCHAFGKDHWAFWRMADRLNAMTVGIQHESAVIVGVIVGPQPRRTVIAPASGERRRVKGVQRPSTRSAEAEMRAWNWSFDLGFVGDRKFNTKLTRCRTIVGAAALAEVNDAYKPERAQRSIIETTTTVDVSDTDRDMIQHRMFPLGWLPQNLLEAPPTLPLPKVTTDQLWFRSL